MEKYYANTYGNAYHPEYLFSFINFHYHSTPTLKIVMRSTIQTIRMKLFYHEFGIDHCKFRCKCIAIINCYYSLSYRQLISRIFFTNETSDRWLKIETLIGLSDKIYLVLFPKWRLLREVFGITTFFGLFVVEQSWMILHDVIINI